MRTLISLTVAALLFAAPATAQDDAEPACPDGQVETPEGCSQQAWVEDCPPDRLCAASQPDDPHAYGDESCIECSGPVDEPIQYGNESCIECSGPVDEPVQYGEDGCIDCTGAPQDLGTCMDGTDGEEVCMEDVQYFGPGPADTGNLDDSPAPGSDDQPVPAKDASALPAALLLAGLGALLLVLRRK